MFIIPSRSGFPLTRLSFATFFLMATTFYASIAESSGSFCPSLPPPEGPTITVNSAQTNNLQSIVETAPAGSTILLADGLYTLNGAYLHISADGVTIRSASGDRDGVILDGGYVTDEIIQIVASDVTIADLTLKRARYHPIHVTPPNDEDVLNTMIYNVHIIDPGQQAIKINSNWQRTHFTDYGEIACSRIELTDDGRPYVWSINESCYTGGIDAHQSMGWTIRDNEIEGFWCENDLSEHGIHIWRGSRDTIVIRNQLKDNVRGIGFGLSAYEDDVRTYSDTPCPGTSGYIGHYNGLILNNFVFQTRDELLTSEYGFDSGIAVSQSCGTKVIHNSVVSTATPFSSIEYRFANTDIDIINNLVSHNIMMRDGASASLTGNILSAPLDIFTDPIDGDLHLLNTATVAMDEGVDPELDDDTDIDGQTRTIPPDVGADEYIDCSTGLREIILVLKIITGSHLEDGDCPQSRMDVNNDGRIDLADGLLLLQQRANNY